MNLKQKEIKLDNKNLTVDPASIRKYIDLVGYNEPDLLSELRRETKRFGPLSIMQIGPTQGTLLRMLCQLGKFKKCLEIGIFTGYSSICISSSLTDDGKLFALDNNEEYLEVAKKYWKLAKVDKKINLLFGDASESLDTLCKTMQKTFDFIFIDADKNNYMKYYENSLVLLKPQGLMAIDNTIWKGRVLDDADKSKSTESIRKLNKHIKNDDRVEHCILTIYDGMKLCVKK